MKKKILIGVGILLVGVFVYIALKPMTKANVTANTAVYSPGGPKFTLQDHKAERLE